MVRTRFAPSPTGSLHVGGVRTALYCLLYARKRGGAFVLRIEDTDQARSTDEAAAGILRDLQWCGLQWDEGPGIEGAVGPYYQSRRLALYDRYVDQLLASGHAYLAWDSKAELDALRKAAEANKSSFRYKGGPVDPDREAAFRAEGRVPVVRLHAPTRDLTVEDRILGPVTVATDDLEDIVIRKGDGFPTYHFAVVIDDATMGITDVLRGQEHLLNTHKHLGIYEALGWTPPRVGHLPLIFNPAAQKMSKRDKAKVAREAMLAAQKREKHAGWAWLAAASGRTEAELTAFAKKENDGVAMAEAIGAALGVELPLIEVIDYRRGGYLPEALINYMALLGWNPGDDRELMGLDELTEAFDLDRVNHTSARFDPAKLLWMNGEYMKRAPTARLLAAIDDWLTVADGPIRHASEAQRRALIAMYRERARTIAELDRMSRFFFVRPTTWDPKAVDKHVRGEGSARLRELRDALVDVPWEAPAIDAVVAQLGEAVGVGKVAQPLRIALTGTGVSPGIGDTAAFLSRDEVLVRIDALLATV